MDDTLFFELVEKKPSVKRYWADNWTKINSG